MRSFLIVPLVTSLLYGTAMAVPPNLISYQGRLTELSGNPVVDNTYAVTFSIYATPSGGAPLWSELQTVATKSGLFSALLGSVTPFTPTAFSDSIRYLGIKVGTDPELTPRNRLASVPFALSTGWSKADSVVRLNTSSDLVGIGTNNPAAKLEVDSGDVYVGRIPTPPPFVPPSENLYIGNSVGDPKVSFRIDGWNNDLAIVAHSEWGAGSGGSISFRTGLAQAGEFDQMRITPVGSVGIGTTNPLQRLHVVGGGCFTDAVGIGTSTPSEKLTVAGSMEIGTNAGDYQHLRIGGGNSSGFLYGSYPGYGDGIHLGYNFYADASGNAVWANPGGETSRLSLGYGYIGMYVGGVGARPLNLGVYVNGIGNVGIGTGAPAYRLDVAGSAHATSFPTSSDNRLKKNIRLLDHALERIEQIRGVSFDWNATYERMGRSSGHREIGVIAQEVEKVFPELVTTWGEEKYRAVDYGRLSAVLIEAIKEQQKQIQELKVEIARLEKSQTLAKSGQ